MMQAAGQAPHKARTGIDWRLCLLVLALAAGVALCVSHGQAWQLPDQVQAHLAQSALLARTRDAQSLVLGTLRTWQGSTGRLLLMQRCASPTPTWPTTIYTDLCSIPPDLETVDLGEEQEVRGEHAAVCLGLQSEVREQITCRAHAEDALRRTRRGAAVAWGKARRAAGWEEAAAPAGAGEQQGVLGEAGCGRPGGGCGEGACLGRRTGNAARRVAGAEGGPPQGVLEGDVMLQQGMQLPMHGDTFVMVPCVNISRSGRGLVGRHNLVHPGVEVWGWTADQGMGVLLVGGSQAATAAAALAVEQALPRNCRDCLLVFKVCCK